VSGITIKLEVTILGVKDNKQKWHAYFGSDCFDNLMIDLTSDDWTVRLHNDRVFSAIGNYGTLLTKRMKLVCEAR